MSMVMLVGVGAVVVKTTVDARWLRGPSMTPIPIAKIAAIENRSTVGEVKMVARLV